MSIIPFPTTRRTLPGFTAPASAGHSAATPAKQPVKPLDLLFQSKTQNLSRQSGAATDPQSEIVIPVSRPEIIRRGHAALKKLTGFIGASQLAAVMTALRGEEGIWFMEKMESLAGIVENMPKTYETDGQGDDAICHLHYFGGSYDGYLIEKDMEESEDPAEAQWQAFGFVHWAHMPGDAEKGYICLPEIFKSHMELDFHFDPTPLREIKRKHGLKTEPIEVTATESAPPLPVSLNSDTPSSSASLCDLSASAVPSSDPITELQKTFLSMPDGYQPGAILYSSWGWEQTNIDFYRIEKRSGLMLTLAPLQNTLTEGGFMSGTRLPTANPKDYATDSDTAWGNKDLQNPKPLFKRKLKLGDDGKPNGLVINHGWCRLWEAKPMTCSWYA